MTKREKNVWVVIAGLFGVTVILFLIAFASGSGTGQTAASQQQAQPPAAAAGQQTQPAPAASAGNTVSTASGLQYIEEVVGTGPQPVSGQIVVVHYTGYLDDGTVFDSSVQRGQPAEFNIDQVVPGFREGIMGMKVGGKRKLIIPPELGYGAQGNGSIPPNARLTFDVELLGVK